VPIVSAAPTEGGRGRSGVRHRVWIDQDLCTGDGICVQEARNVFEFDIDGLAYVKNADGDLLTQPAAETEVPADTFSEVVEAARKCPGACIHVVRADDGVEIAGPDA
jgi:ferredoxin